jgi:2-succinyl-5-enolpyruvyl-6-hydroxy-3-cyclohexene-1-carboxylate synthase
MVFEVFTDSVNETEALKMLFSLEVSASNAAKGAIKKVLGDKGVKAVKDILGK